MTREQIIRTAYSLYIKGRHGAAQRVLDAGARYLETHAEFRRIKIICHNQEY